MTFYSKVGHWNNKTNGTSDTISGVGFTPVALILWAGNQSATGWQADTALNVMFSMGFSAANGAGPTMQYGSTCHATLNHNNSYRYQYQYQAPYSLILYDYGGTLKLQISSVAFNSDGFVATYSTTPGTAYTIYYLALGGTDITAAGVTGWQSNTSTGNQSVTLAGTSFQPTAVLHISDEFTSAPPVGQGSVIGSLICGAMDANGNQWSNNTAGLYRSALWPTSSLEDRTQVTNACIVNVNAANQTSATGGNTISDVASFVSMNAGGFTVNWTTKSANGYYFYSLALAGPNIKAGNFTKTGQVGAVTDTVTGLGFTPTAVLAVTDSYPASAANIIHSRFTLGASDGTNFGVVAKTGQSNIEYLSYTVYSNYNDSTNSIIVANSTAGNTTDVAATINNFLSGRFDIVWGTDTTTDATQVLYIAFGSSTVTVAAATATLTCNANTSVVGIGLTGQTAQITHNANTTLIGAGLTSQTAAASFTANTSIIGTGLVGQTAKINLNANVPLIGVGFDGQTASMEFDANVPSLIWDVVVSGLSAETDFNANVPDVGIGIDGQTASVEFDANTASAVWDVVVAGLTAEFIFFANLAVCGNDFVVVPPTAQFAFNANIGLAAWDILVAAQTAHTTFNSNVASVVWDVVVAGLTAQTDFNANTTLIDTGSLWIPAQTQFNANVGSVVLTLMSPIPFAVRPSLYAPHIAYNPSFIPPAERNIVAGTVAKDRKISSGTPQSVRVECNLTPEDTAKINLFRAKIKV